jgi:iron complex transport system substrate-binding protein
MFGFFHFYLGLVMKIFSSFNALLSSAISLCCVLIASQTFAAYPTTVTDLAGRQVVIKETPERVILGDSRYLNALSVIFPENPLQHVAAMLSDLKSIDFGTYKAYEARFPIIQDIPIIGRTSVQSFSIESAITLSADLAIFSLDGHGPNARHSDVIATLEKAGVKVIFVDFRQHPLTNTLTSIDLLGEVFQRQSAAQRFSEFYSNELNKVTKGLSSLKNISNKEVFIHSRVGVSNACCETMVRGMIADFVIAAGGHNIADAIVPGAAGVINLEHLLTHQPEAYIATAVGSKGMPNEGNTAALPYVMLGAGTPKDDATRSLKSALIRNNLQHLDAVTSGNAHAIWHGFYNSPLNVAAIQRIAKWLYPDTFSDLNPDATLARIFNEFQAIDQTGTYWVTLGPAKI